MEVSTRQVSIRATSNRSLVVSVHRTTKVVVNRSVIIATNVSLDKNHVHNQDVPNSVWVINHGLGKYPTVDTIDSSGNLVFGHINYVSLNTIHVTFSAPFSGRAYCN